MTSDSEATFEFDVALSFAGEDRTYVHGIADRLLSRGVRVFYDEFAAADTWGTDLGEFLDEMYRNKARFTVAFISTDYVRKPWPTHERRSALARALSQPQPYFLPVRLDDSDVPGLRSTVGFVDARRMTPERIVDLVLEKIGRLPGQAQPTPMRMGVPENAEQQLQLLARRPSGWEYMLFAGVLKQGLRATESKWRDHRVKYVRRTGPRLDNTRAFAFLGDALHEADSIVDNLVRLLSPEVQESAFGPPGVPGDPAQIEYIGERFITSYEDLLSWGMRIRGTMVPEELSRIFEITARFLDKPIENFREFVSRYAAEADRLPERLANPSDRPIDMSFTLVIDIDERTQNEHKREMKRLKRKRFWGQLD